MSNYRNKSYKSKQYKGSPDGKSAGDRAADKFSSMMIEALTRMKASDWKQGWVGGNGHTHGLPQNVDGRVYKGTNSFFLQMDTAMHGYKMPVYMTYLNIQKEGAHVLKGTTSMPVIYWDLSIKDKDGHRVSIDDFHKMSQAEQQTMDIHPFLKAYNVFNLDQTNFQEVKKEKYDKIVARFQGIQLRDEKGMYVNPALDKMLKEQAWLCPIQYDKIEEGAYYSPREDKVVIPTKAQFNISPTKDGIFKDGMEYYSNLLHECTHSTSRHLHRETGGRFGDAKYAKEELVAELSAALVGNALGFDKRILDNNAAYVDGWLDALSKEPQFIISVMSDVTKASNLIMEKVDEQLLSLGEEPLLQQDRKEGTHKSETLEAVKGEEQQTAKSQPKEATLQPLEITDGSIFKKRDGTYAVRAFHEGQNLGVKHLSREAAEQYLAMKDGPQKDKTLKAILYSKYTLSDDLFKNGRSQSSGMKM